MRLGMARVAASLMVGFAIVFGGAVNSHAQCCNTKFGTNALSSNTVGNGNTAVGESALQFNNAGSFNSAFGYQALLNNSSGNSNVAVGMNALKSNNGYYNSAIGTFSLEANTSGNSNVATGTYALNANQTGSFNTATGSYSLHANVDGKNDTASGFQALFSNIDGTYNSATGSHTMYSNTSGSWNSAYGGQALFSNTTGTDNTAQGLNSLYSNTTGSYNVAVGLGAMSSNTTGSRNTTLGYHAGAALTTGGNNLDIANYGVADEANTIRIGTHGSQNKTFIAGISGVPVVGADVVVGATGQLGVVASSARYKRDIKDMGASTDKLVRLRPVTFKYKSDEHATTQYGLIAEEVEKVYPELVAYGADGQVETVRYSMLTSMLLNEVQKQAAELRGQKSENARLAAQLASTQKQVDRLNNTVERRLASVEQALAKDRVPVSITLYHPE